MIEVVAQAVADINVADQISRRLDLVGLFVLFVILLVRKVFVIGWVFEANEKRLREAEELRDRLIQIQMRTIESADVRRNA